MVMTKPSTPWWINLYNCSDASSFHEMNQARLTLWFRTAQTPRPPIPTPDTTTTVEWNLYKAFVRGWLTHSLTPHDWTCVPMWTGREITLNELLTPTDHPVFTPTFVQYLKSNPREPLLQAYRQIARIMMQERLGMPSFRPHICSACTKVYQPQLPTLHDCARPARTSRSPRTDRANHRPSITHHPR